MLRFQNGLAYYVSLNYNIGQFYKHFYNCFDQRDSS